MKRMYAPWRSKYTTTKVQAKKEGIKKADCIFCAQFSQKNDAKAFILKRYTHTVVMLNKYPYNAGHLLIVPLAHQATLDKLSKAARAELMELIAYSATMVRTQLEAQGINIGLNIGKASGSSIPSHLHFHVLPRWQGDTNFLPTLADTKQISVDLHELYEKLKKVIAFRASVPQSCSE